MSKLESTGERLVPLERGRITYEHFHRYAICFAEPERNLTAERAAAARHNESETVMASWMEEAASLSGMLATAEQYLTAAQETSDVLRRELAAALAGRQEDVTNLSGLLAESEIKLVARAAEPTQRRELESALVTVRRK